MADWAADVKKYDANADDEVIAGIVRHCGIALQKQDSSLVSFGDPQELKRVRDGFIKKKLAITDSDEEIDAALAKVGETLKGAARKNRVTVYYLLAKQYGQLSLFEKKK
jgi:predicted ATP-dependent endonuclease of OLD family